MAANFSELEEGERVSSCPVHSDSSLEKIFKTLAYCVMLLLALSGNILLVCVVYSQRRLRTTTNFLISNMAISDLLVPVFAMPRTIVEIHLGLRRWLVTGSLGLALCKMIYFLQDVSTAVSVLSLSCITIDRFYAIVRPQNSTPIKGRVRSVIASIWIIAMLMHGTYFYTFKLVTVNDVTLCVLRWPSTIDSIIATKIFFLILIVLLYFIPLMLIIILQWFIVKKMKKQRLPSFSSSFRQRKRGRRNKKVVHFTLAVIVTFFFCWTPTVVYSFAVIFGGKCVPELFRFASLFLVQSNSSINFFIYFLFNDNYRNTFKKIFCERNVLAKTISRTAEGSQLEVERKRARSKTLSLDILPDAKNYVSATEDIDGKSQVNLVGMRPVVQSLECGKREENGSKK